MRVSLRDVRTVGYSGVWLAAQSVVRKVVGLAAEKVCDSADHLVEKTVVEMVAPWAGVWAAA